MKEADFTYWKNCKEWTFTEAFFLVRGLSPIAHRYMSNNFSHELFAEWYEWIEWSKRYSGDHTLSALADDEGKSRPKEELLEWASSLDGVEVHEMWDGLYKSSGSSPKNPELGERERENLMATIGLLALSLAEATGPETGSKLKPKISAIVDRCESIAEHPPGLGRSTLRNRIREGIYALMEKHDIAS